MRAITGGVVSSEPCPLVKAVRFLNRFSESAAAHLPSSDCDTYLRTVAYATARLCLFREELGGRQKQGAAEGNRSHQDHQESKGGMAVATDGSHRDYAAGAELDVASAKKKDKKKKKNENPPEDRAVARADSHIPSSPEIATEKRKKKHPNKETIVRVKQEPSFVVEEALVTEKKKSKKKKEKNHVKLEEDVDEVEEKIVSDSAAEQRVAGKEREEELVSEKKKSKKKKEKNHAKLEEDVDEVEEKIVIDSAAEQRVIRKERERKKKKHEQEEGGTEVVKEEKTIADGDLDIEKKRKKKRGRGDIYDNAPEQVEHTKKKQKKHSGD